jgi:hypothetical protein
MDLPFSEKIVVTPSGTDWCWSFDLGDVATMSGGRQILSSVGRWVELLVVRDSCSVAVVRVGSEGLTRVPLETIRLARYFDPTTEEGLCFEIRFV